MLNIFTSLNANNFFNMFNHLDISQKHAEFLGKPRGRGPLIESHESGTYL